MMASGCRAGSPGEPSVQRSPRSPARSRRRGRRTTTWRRRRCSSRRDGGAWRRRTTQGPARSSRKASGCPRQSAPSSTWRIAGSTSARSRAPGRPSSRSSIRRTAGARRTASRRHDAARTRSSPGSGDSSSRFLWPGASPISRYAATASSCAMPSTGCAVPVDAGRPSRSRRAHRAAGRGPPSCMRRTARPRPSPSLTSRWPRPLRCLRRAPQGPRRPHRSPSRRRPRRTTPRPRSSSAARCSSRAWASSA